jgi:hypothetical protein
MAFTITDYCEVRARALELGLNEPEGFALLPCNFDSAPARDDLLHESEVQTVRILFRENDIPENRVEPEGYKIPCVQENEFAVVLPALFVGTLILSQNPHLLSLALSVIANYATDFFRGLPGRNKVVLDVVVEDKTRKRSKKIHYDGGIEGLKEISEVVGKVFSDDEPH